MAIIDKDTRMTVATRLANLNYKEQMDSSLAKLNEKRDDAKKPASNLCDTIENIRATLKPNLKEALKHDKEEE